MTTESLPAVNAGLNALATVLLIGGWAFIRNKAVTPHKLCMIAALVVSALFLGCYVVYHVQHGSTKFPIGGFWYGVYLVVLVPHIVLAVVQLPLIYFTFSRAFRERFDAHRRIARWTLPLWLYVSVTGVVVYWMLYRVTWEA